MALEELNQYKGTFADGTTNKAVAATIKDAADLFTDILTGVEPTIIQCLEKGIRVLVPSALVHFITDISPPEAVAGLCVATPQTFTVEDGTEVIFSAIPAVGWAFSKWQRNGVDIVGAVDPVMVIPVTAGTPSNELVTYTAVFLAAP